MSSLNQDEKVLALVAHLGSFGGYIFPFANIIVPLVIWLVKKDESGFVDYHGKESLNFQISMTIYYIVAGLLTLILIGFVLLLGLLIFNIVVVIMAAIKAYDGEYYTYPLCIRLIK